METYRKGGKSGRDVATQPREASVRAGVSEQGNRRRGIAWPPAWGTSREPSRIGAKLLAGIWRYWSDTGQAAGQPSNAAWCSAKSLAPSRSRAPSTRKICAAQSAYLPPRDGR